LSCQPIRLAVTVFLLVAASALAQQPIGSGGSRRDGPAERTTFLDPRSAGPDFEIQGEYQGQLRNGERYAVQVIALGDGAFRAVGYHGGLPGDGWNGSQVETSDGRLQDAVARFKTERGSGEIAAGVLRLFDLGGMRHGELRRIERRSPTLGLKAPPGAVILFDGGSTAHWRGTRARDGLLQVGGQTRQSFRDCRLHLEFQTPFMPGARGQDRGNSGVFLQRLYEIQILDSFGLEGADNECGAIYSFRKPAVNMCLPPLAWQTYDVDFTMARFDSAGNKTANARVTVKHNGVVIQDDVELSGSTHNPLRNRESREGGPLYLQYHRCPVQFRNIWLVEK
jgi:hypothetical protein